jgi:hypothetical protein
MRGFHRSGWGVLGALLVVRTALGQTTVPREVRETPPQQMTMPMSATSMPAAPLGIDEVRNGSGTAWLPDDSPMRGAMWDAGPWSLMLHGAGALQYVQTTGARGDHEVGSVNWFMSMAERTVGGGALTVRGMTSLEPLTVGRCGYPDVLQTGELCLGAPLHDAQHPHNLFMELAADYRRAVTSSLAIEIYGGPVGEPALGPVAFPHRPSAMGSPTAPIGHHWLDSSHLSFGVVTAGAYTRRWKAEASVFNGREPDDRRYRIELAPLDSYSGRIWWLPSPQWSVEVSAGHLKGAEQRPVGPRADVTRVTASTTYHRQTLGRLWATTVAWGRNIEGGQASSALLVETTAETSARDTWFARVEAVGKTSTELVIPVPPDDVFVVSKAEVGYTRWVKQAIGLKFGMGGSLGISRLPANLSATYGARSPGEVTAFLAIRSR